MTFDLKGKQVTQTGALFTVALRKLDTEWRLIGLGLGKRRVTHRRAYLGRCRQAVRLDT